MEKNVDGSYNENEIRRGGYENAERYVAKKH